MRVRLELESMARERKFGALSDPMALLTSAFCAPTAIREETLFRTVRS
jgi:hypothetical protein